MARKVAGQTVGVPDVTGGVADAYSGSSPLVKAIVILIVVLVGLELYGKWTGNYIGTFNLLGPNAVGAGINAAEHPPTNTQTRILQAGYNMPHSTAAGVI